MSWLKMRVELQSHPKTVRILSATGTDKFRVVGGLHAVWAVFDTHSVDGKLRGYTPELLDHIIGWQGFSRAMESVGWLEFDGVDLLQIPEFSEHNGQSAKRRAEDQKRKKAVRNLSAECPQDERTKSGLEKEKEKDKKEQKKEPGVSRQQAGTRLAEDWSLPADWMAWARAERPDLNIQLQAASFADYWHGVPGAKGRKADWLGTWRNWIRRADSGRNPQQNGTYVPMPGEI